ncbi:MAG: hypothetical protein J6X75_04985 [Clostridia bacterium]|nr:hypothetical protein [Clostridia bacterium]
MSEYDETALFRSVSSIPESSGLVAYCPIPDTNSSCVPLTEVAQGTSGFQISLIQRKESRLYPSPSYFPSPN